MPKNAAAVAPTDNWDEGAEPEATVRVKCIVHTKPHTGGAEAPDDSKAHRGLLHGEERDLPESVAAILLKRKQVERV